MHEYPSNTLLERSRDVTKKQKEDKFLIEHPELWPKKVVLPLRRVREFEDLPEVGFIIYNPDFPLSIVFQDTVLVFNEYWSGERKGGLRDLERLVYRSIRRMLLDGWEVDND